MKRHFLIVLVALVALLALGGAAMAQDDQLAAVDLVLWSQDQDLDKIMPDLFQTWADAYAPGSTLQIVNIETEEMRNQLLTAGLAGSGLPDFFVGPNDPIGVFVDAGIIQPLDELFDVSVYSGTLAAAQLNGVTYGVPQRAGNHLMLLYNKSLVDAAPDTWEDLIAWAADFAAANPDIQPFAYNLNEPFWFLPFVGGFGGSVFDADGALTLGTQPWVDAYQFVQDLKFVHGVVPQECDYACADSTFKEGSTAIIINGDWSLSGYLDVAQSPALGPDNLGIAPWPALPNGSRPTPYTSGKFFSVPVTTEGDQLAAVVSFLTWLTADKDAVIQATVPQGWLPALTAAYDDPMVTDDPLLAASASALATGIGMPPNVELRCMWDSVRPSLEAVMANTMTPADAAADAQAAGDACVEDLQ